MTQYEVDDFQIEDMPVPCPGLCLRPPIGCLYKSDTHPNSKKELITCAASSSQHIVTDETRQLIVLVAGVCLVFA